MILPGNRELGALLQEWPSGQEDLKEMFLSLGESAAALAGARASLISRPGVSHSLRFDLNPRPAGRRRPVFFLVDVVPAGEEIFLSVCFYQDEIGDPEDLGNAIPQGLFQETGYCFDVDQLDQELLTYLRQRLVEAHLAAGGRP